MQVEYLDQLRRAISEQRIGPYRRQASDSVLRAYGLYAWNIALCESLYPVLNGLEIALRNSIHDAATAEFGDEYWFDKLWLDNTKRTIENTRRGLDRDNKSKDTITVGELVARLTFGLWVGLFDSQYDQWLWHKLLRPVFPNIPGRRRLRRVLAHRLHHIRIMRNRVFHHEPIWYWQDLVQQHQEILETIGWINSAMVRFIGTLDRFPEVHGRGPQPYEDAVESGLHNSSAP